MTSHYLRRHGAWLLGIAMVFGATRAAEESSPVVRMLVPGFTVRELPLRLSNQNNLRFAPDGSLTSLGYDGKVWRLRDSDGDGLEDQAEAIWDQSTLSVPLGMAWSTDGLYVSSKGKVSRLRDTNQDGRADTEEIVASGWPTTDVGSGGVDATAVTLDSAGNVYFGLLVADYSNAYRLRKRAELKPNEVDWLRQHGRWREPAGTDSGDDLFSLYDLASPRGTIQKWDPRTGKMTTLATGLRVPVALAFNREGDLFNTDQEGETWMPGGNPLDELNHIVAGRNYGFPPRHERWLPDLMSEPPVVSFGPQHQSTCGLVFNEPRPAFGSPNPGSMPLPAGPAQGLFGPGWWSGDAFVAGESRGKIWRVRLAKTPHGYIGKSYPIAQLSMLTLDVAISPQGNMYVACHSGPPDWGTGPQGEGRIFQISYTDTNAPQPVITWAASPTEVRVSFDRPLSLATLDGSQSGVVGVPGEPGSSSGQPADKFTQIEFGEYVRAGGRGETLKPPYEVVSQQDATPRGRLAIHSRRLEDASRTLVLTTDPHPLAVTYVLPISGFLREYHPGRSYEAEVEYDLSGCQAEIIARRPEAVEKPLYQIWYPHPDWQITEQLVRNSFAHSEFDAHRNGRRFELKTRALLPEGLTEFEWSDPGVAPRFGLDWVLELMNSGEVGADSTVELTATAEAWYDGWPQPQLAASHPPHGALFTPPLSWFTPPWVPTTRPSSGTDSRPIPKPDGDWETGRDLFANRLQCAKCHRIRGEGGLAGPDLSNLIHRDPVSVRRDIVDPGATLHPDYVTFQADLTNGDSVVGFLRAQGTDTLQLFDAEGKVTTLTRSEVRNLHPTGQSLMPTGLLDGLKDTEIRDLLTFLMHEPPRRTHAELKSAAGSHESEQLQRSPLHLVLVASKQDHGLGQHDYPAWQAKWLRLLQLAAASNGVVEKAWEWPTAVQFQSASVLVFYCWNHDWSAARLAELDAYQRRGGGLVLLHSAVIADQEPEVLAERIGISAQPGRTGYRHMPFELTFIQPKHVLLSGMPERLNFLDEPYWPLVGNVSAVEVLATGQVEGMAQPLIWTFERGPGRVFASILGHYFWTLDDPWFRLLVFRAVGWAAHADPESLTSTAMDEVLWK